MDAFDEEASKPVSAAFPPPADAPESPLEIIVKPPDEEEEIFNNTSPLAAMRDTVENLMRVNRRMVSFDPTHPQVEHEIPIIEVISQDAIEELIENLFNISGASDIEHLTLDEFKRVVQHDMGLLAWFEALGTIF
jgi:hypothetical protein